MCLHQDVQLQPFQLSVGDGQEVPAPAGRIEDAKFRERLANLPECRERLGSFNSVAPRANDRRENDLLNVRLAGEVRTVRMALRLAHAALEQGAEDRWLDARPVLASRPSEQLEFIPQEFDRLNGSKESAVEIPHFAVPASSRRIR